MPHMQRLTWTGIALHAGQLPGYPPSAGCLRLPVDFAAKLYAVTSQGTTANLASDLIDVAYSIAYGKYASPYSWPPVTRNIASLVTVSVFALSSSI
jgi:hypothetical protein